MNKIVETILAAKISQFILKVLVQKCFLSNEIARSSQGVSLSQIKYLMSQGCWDLSKLADPPLDPNTNMDNKERDLLINTGRYKKLVGS